MKRLGGRFGLSGVLVAIGAAAAVFGTAKTLAEALTGNAYSVADLAYYTGNAALVAYYCVAAFGVAGVALLVASDHWSAPAWADGAIVLVPIVARARGDGVRGPHLHVGPRRRAGRRGAVRPLRGHRGRHRRRARTPPLRPRLTFHVLSTGAACRSRASVASRP